MNVLRSVLKWLLIALAAYFGVCTVLLILFTWVEPLFTTVQAQRAVESLFESEPYDFQYEPVERAGLSEHLPHAVVAAEDTRFYEHNGIDWEAVGKAVEEMQEGERRRGASSITQQLAKNLFLTTHSNWIRKGFEVLLTHLTELILSKERILTLYLNVVELDRGVYGAEAAAQHYFGTSAASLSRWQSASLAALLPAPRTRSPHNMQQYASTILGRMKTMGW